MAILKRQLEEKEKLLATEQEDAAAAKSKLRELNKVGPAPGRPGGCGCVRTPAQRGPSRDWECTGWRGQSALRLWPRLFRLMPREEGGHGGSQGLFLRIGAESRGGCLAGLLPLLRCLGSSPVVVQHVTRMYPVNTGLEGPCCPGGLGASFRRGRHAAAPCEEEVRVPCRKLVPPHLSCPSQHRALRGPRPVPASSAGQRAQGGGWGLGTSHTSGRLRRSLTRRQSLS